MGKKREPLHKGARDLWHYGVIFLGILVFWFLTSAGWFGFQNGQSYQRFVVMMINKTGLLTILFAGRYLLFPGNRSRRLFSLALGGALLWLIVTKILVNFENTGQLAKLEEVGDGAIWCLCGAWLLELVAGLYSEWFRAPLEVSTLSEMKHQWGMALLKLGLFSAGFICFLELYWLNDLAVEMIPVGYYLSIPFIGMGFGLYGIFWYRMNRWVKERVRVVDDLLLQMDGEAPFEKKLFQGLPMEEMERAQLLLLWRSYLRDIKKPGLAWWIWGEYLVLSGLIISLPYWIKVVAEV